MDQQWCHICQQHYVKERNIRHSQYDYHRDAFMKLLDQYRTRHITPENVDSIELPVSAYDTHPSEIADMIKRYQHSLVKWIKSGKR